nr:PHB depolymerase family esterase [uncultured Albidiferax sp.]
MSALFKKFLQEATRLTQTGNLQDATRAIQQALGRISSNATARAPFAAPPTAPSTAPSAPTSTPWTIDGCVTEVETVAGVSNITPPIHRPVAEPVHPLHVPDQPASNDGPGEFSAAEFTHAGTTRAYKLYTPPHAIQQPARPLPLVLMLHGCTQNPDDFAAGTGMNALAQEHGFLVLYPAQIQAANSHRCWNWFNTQDQRRDSGEPAWLAALVQQVAQQRAVDPSQIYVAGLSAGGAMASILGHTHPDLFAAVGVHSGLACGAANNVISALSVMKNGRSPPGAASSLPTIVFHGDADATVHPSNGEAVLQAAIGQDTTTSQANRGTAAGGQSYTRTTYQTADGNSLAEYWQLHGAGHAWSGGNRAGTYTDPLGPNASAEMWRFFQAHPRKTLH